jgi:uncharacterized protein (DUF58 family)
VNRAIEPLRAIAASFRHRAATIESWTESFYPYRSLRLTRDGWFFLGVTIAIGLAALNTGHNLFYLVFAMLVSLIVVSGLLSERVVRHLRVERRLPCNIFARRPTAVEVRVRNTSRHRTCYAVEIHDGLEGQERRRVGYVDRLDPGAERVFVAVWTCPRRGRQALQRIHFVTRFPFGLFEKTRIVATRESHVIFPAVGDMEARRLAQGAGQDGFRKHRLGEEIVGLRRKLDDDDPRRIHWRVSARAGEWMVTEHAERLDRPLALFFDNRGLGGSAFERAVERAASLLWSASRAGRTAHLYSWDTAFREDGPEALHGALTFLAEVAPLPPKAAPDDSHFREWQNEVQHLGGGFFITLGEAPSVPPDRLLRVA